jgi:hypothetical protein
MSGDYARNYNEIEWLPIPKHEPVPIRKARSHLPGPMLIRDDMEPVQSMLDGKLYTSKSRLRRTYREAGVTEVGNDVKFDPPPPPRSRVKRKEIEAAVGKAFSRVGLGA